jgi:hypothetical protein
VDVSGTISAAHSGLMTSCWSAEVLRLSGLRRLLRKTNFRPSLMMFEKVTFVGPFKVWAGVNKSRGTRFLERTSPPATMLAIDMVRHTINSGSQGEFGCREAHRLIEHTVTAIVTGSFEVRSP